MLETISPELRAYQEQKLTAYEVANGKEEKGGIVFTGDSLIEFFPLKKMLGHEHRLINRGIAGTDTIWLREHIGSQVCPLQPDRLFILIGTNDLGQGFIPRDIVRRISDLLAEIRENSFSSSIYLLSLLPVSEADQYSSKVKARRNADIREVNQALQVLSGADFIDLYPSLLDREGNLAEAYTTDGLHLTQEAYVLLAEQLYPYLG